MSCGCPEPCPDPLDQTPDTGCLKPISAECVTYLGPTLDCSGIEENQTLEELLASLNDTICEMQEDIGDINSFSCSDLSSCSIDNLGDVTTSSPSEGQVLMWDGTAWNNSDISFPIPQAWTCNELNACSIDALSNVVVDSPSNGDVLMWNGSEFINTPETIYTSSNAITKTSNNFKLGGTLIEDTTILGSTFNIAFGTSMSQLDDFKVYSSKFLVRGTVISLSETGDETTQTKGLLYKTAGTSISLGTSVFDDFSTYDGIYRIGNDITLAKTGLLDPAGFFMGTNISVDSSPAYALGGDITLENFLGFVVGITNTATGYAGGFIMGSEIDLTGGGTGNQSAYLFGSKIDVQFGAGIAQGSLVFNPTNVQINSSATGNSANEKIRVDDANGFVTTFNTNDYYFFTDTTNTAGWNVNNDVVRFNKNFIQISGSTGSVAEEKEACIRYNTSTNKLQVYTGAGWETVTSA